MDIDRRTLIGGGLCLAGVTVGAACGEPVSDRNRGGPSESDQPSSRVYPPRERFPLWPGRPPGAPAQLPVLRTEIAGGAAHRELDIYHVAAPEVCVYRPARPDGRAVLVIPGGGFGYVSFENEGSSVAERLAEDGVTAFVLLYRLPGDGWTPRGLAPLQDAQRAMRLIRADAARYGIDGPKLGVLGFSAGGHVAADLAVSYGQPAYARLDETDGASARPAFAGLIYAVTDLRALPASGAPVTPLLGANASAARLAERSPVAHVNRDTPPSFLLHAFDDRVVPYRQSLGWMEACRGAGADVEAHLVAEGNHGFGVRFISRSMTGSRWPELFRLWMQRVSRPRH